jgi:mRNA interferase MazF
MAKQHVPEASEIVLINFMPQSLAAYNSKTSLMICCPLTTQIKNYPFEVLIGGTPPTAVLADHVKSIDWRSRNAKPTGQDTRAHWIVALSSERILTAGAETVAALPGN